MHKGYKIIAITKIMIDREMQKTTIIIQKAKCSSIILIMCAEGQWLCYLCAFLIIIVEELNK